MQEHKSDPRVDAFLAKLAALDAGDRARLKRDAGKALDEAQSLGLFYRLLRGIGGIPAAQEETYFLVATLYPLAEGSGKGNFGDAMRQACDPKNRKGLDRRVEALLDSDTTQLPFRLRQAIKFLKSKRVGVNWQSLLEDLLNWNRPRRLVQREWARGYFALPQQRSDKPSPSSQSEEEA